MKLFLSPHNDDEVLFGALTIMRERPLVVVVYDGYVQGNRGVNILPLVRRKETRVAMSVLGVDDAKFLGLRDDKQYTPEDIIFRLRGAVDIEQHFEAVYAPIYDLDGHEQHNLVALASGLLDSAKYEHYSTYTRNGGRQRTPNEVLPLDGSMIARKHRALACYTSQMDMDERLGCWPHFMNDMREYMQ